MALYYTGLPFYQGNEIDVTDVQMMAPSYSQQLLYVLYLMSQKNNTEYKKVTNAEDKAKLMKKFLVDFYTLCKTVSENIGNNTKVNNFNNIIKEFGDINVAPPTVDDSVASDIINKIMDKISGISNGIKEELKKFKTS